MDLGGKVESMATEKDGLAKVIFLSKGPAEGVGVQAGGVHVRGCQGEGS